MQSQNLVVPLTQVNAGFMGVIDSDEEFPSSVVVVKHSKTAKASLTGIVDTDEKVLTGANDTDNTCFDAVIDTGEAMKHQPSLWTIKKL